MLGDISSAVNVYVITGYTDMRKSIDGLCAIVLDQLKTEPDGRSIYLFCGKRCDRIKILLREPDGYVLLYKMNHYSRKIPEMLCTSAFSKYLLE